MKISSEEFDLHLTELACYATALLIFAVGFLKLGQLEPTRAQLHGGLLIIPTLSISFVLMGLLLHVIRAMKSQAAIRPQNTTRH